MSLKNTDVRTPGLNAIAKKFKLSLARVRQLVDQGAKHEKEHNTDLSKAKQVARDHIGERPDYYKMLKKAEKTPVSMKEESATGAVRGLGFVTGDPGVNPVTQYINTNAMAYTDENGNKLDYLKKQHYNLHNDKLGFAAFDPTKIGANKNFIKEAKHPLQANFDKYRKGKLNELGEYDNKGGSPGYEELTASNRSIRKRDVKEQSPANPSYKERPMYERSTGKTSSDMTDAAERGIYEISDTLVGKVSNARFWRKEAPSERLSRYIRRAQLRQPEKKEKAEKKEVKEFWMPFLQKHHVHSARLSKEKSNKPDTIMDPGAGGTTKTIHEETKMDNRELINEALDCILEDNLPEMKDNLMKVLQEKAIEKLEERKKEIAANYFAE